MELENRLRRVWKVGGLYKIKEEAELQQLAICHIETDSPLVRIDSKNEPVVRLHFRDGTSLTRSVREVKQELYIGSIRKF